MFSTHLSQSNTVPREYLYSGAGVLLIVGLLVAIASVASGEVKKAEMRESLLASQRSAAAYCVETMRGTALNGCLKQARADSYGTPSAVMAVAENTVFSLSVPGTPRAGEGFMPVSFGALR